MTTLCAMSFATQNGWVQIVRQRGGVDEVQLTRQREPWEIIFNAAVVIGFFGLKL